MKKDERLIQELLFINSRNRFNLRDLMERFAISKRTALRDIEALERIGVPLYSERGSHGGYHLLEHKFYLRSILMIMSCTLSFSRSNY